MDEGRMGSPPPALIDDGLVCEALVGCRLRELPYCVMRGTPCDEGERTAWLRLRKAELEAWEKHPKRKIWDWPPHWCFFQSHDRCSLERKPPSKADLLRRLDRGQWRAVLEPTLREYLATDGLEAPWWANGHRRCTHGLLFSFTERLPGPVVAKALRSWAKKHRRRLARHPMAELLEREHAAREVVIRALQLCWNRLDRTEERDLVRSLHALVPWLEADEAAAWKVLEILDPAGDNGCTRKTSFAG